MDDEIFSPMIGLRPQRCKLVSFAYLSERKIEKDEEF
jgi:hypothetical protein